jgi:hypothetical protein
VLSYEDSVRKKLIFKELDPVYRHIGQFFFKVFIHQVFVLVFGILFCAGPAVKINLFSGLFDV